MTGLRSVIGLMSGTSLDGVDVALIVTDGERLAELGPARTFPYSETDRDLLRQASVDALALTRREHRPGVLSAAEDLVTRRHAEAVEAFLDEVAMNTGEVDLVGFHGQTVYHDPAAALTVQIGDGAALADRLGIPVVWDFRANDMAAGGQGAPLAPIFHCALARHAGIRGPVGFLNLGGVANITFVGTNGELLAFDTGPGNGLLDDWTRDRLGEAFDRDGTLAASGTASGEVLERLLDHSYFSLPPPKSLDRNTFSLADLSHLSDANGAATLLRFTALSVAASIRHLPVAPASWFASGGGRRNGEMMRAVAAVLRPATLQPIEALGFDGDATEAQAFAFLAARAAAGKPLTFPGTTGVQSATAGGRISRPR